MGRRRPSREAIWIRDGGRCGICKRDVPFFQSSVDHIAPKAVFGRLVRAYGHDPTGVPALLRLAHKRCNSQRKTHAPHWRDVNWHLLAPEDESLMRHVVRHYAGWWNALGCPIDFTPFVRDGNPLLPLLAPHLDSIPSSFILK